MDGTFVFKVSDILLHSGAQDTVSFGNMFSSLLPGLQDGGITGTISFKNLNKTELLLTIIEATADIQTSCDRCGKWMVEKRVLENISIQGRVTNTPSLSEDIVGIDPKDLTIDIEPFLRDQFLLHQPLKILCTNCEENIPDDDNEYEDSYTRVVRH